MLHLNALKYKECQFYQGDLYWETIPKLFLNVPLPVACALPGQTIYIHFSLVSGLVQKELFPSQAMFSFFCFQELFFLCLGQPEPSPALGLEQTQPHYCTGQTLFPLQSQAVLVRNPQDGRDLRD